MTFHYADDVPIQIGDKYMGHALVAPDNNDFAPRIGLAYSPTRAWTIRSGFGMFYARDIANTVFDMGRNLGGRGQWSADTEVPNAPVEDPWRALQAASQCSNWSGMCSVQPQIFTMPYNTRTPYVLQYIFNVQRQIDSEFGHGDWISRQSRAQVARTALLQSAGAEDWPNRWLVGTAKEALERLFRHQSVRERLQFQLQRTQCKTAAAFLERADLYGRLHLV